MMKQIDLTRKCKHIFGGRKAEKEKGKKNITEKDLSL